MMFAWGVADLAPSGCSSNAFDISADGRKTQGKLKMMHDTNPFPADESD